MMEHQDGECICLFCQKTDSLYVINNSSLMIGSSMVRCQDIIFEIFFAKVIFIQIESGFYLNFIKIKTEIAYKTFVKLNILDRRGNRQLHL